MCFEMKITDIPGEMSESYVHNLVTERVNSVVFENLWEPIYNAHTMFHRDCVFDQIHVTFDRGPRLTSAPRSV